MSEKYSVHDYTVEQILNFIKSNEIADCVKFSSQFHS